MDNDFNVIDSEGKYPACGLRRLDRLAVRIMELAPDARLERTRDAYQICSGDEDGVVLLVTCEAIEFRLPTVEWTGGAYGPVGTSRLWKRVSLEKLTTTGELDAEAFFGLLAAAKRKRASEFKKCRFCKKSFPPEHRHGDVCHGCAEQHLGIVH